MGWEGCGREREVRELREGKRSWRRKRLGGFGGNKKVDLLVVTVMVVTVMVVTVMVVMERVCLFRVWVGKRQT